MSIDKNMLSFPGAENPHPEDETPPQRAVTRTEALKAKLVDTKQTYLLVTILWEIVCKYYIGSGVPRNLWEPMKSVVQQLSAPFAKRAAENIVGDLESDVDPALDDVDSIVGDLTGTVEALEKGADDIQSPETNERFSVKVAVQRTKERSAKIRRDLAVGARHHRMVSRFLRGCGLVAPFVEAVGLMVFVSFEYDVPWLAPWVAPLPWTVGLTVVVVLTLSLKFFTEHSGLAHNHAREAFFEGNKTEGERALRSRLGWGIAATVIAVGITTAMVERAIVAMVGGGMLVSAVLLLLALLSGLTCPIVSWMAVALNGSSASRELFALIQQLDRSRDAQDELIASAQEDIAEFDEISREVVDLRFPSIVDAALTTLCGARAVFGFLRLQLRLPEATPPVGRIKMQNGPRGPIGGTISNGLPGADEVSLQPVLDRYLRLAHVRLRVAELVARLAAIEPHPWDYQAAEQDLEQVLQ